MATHRHIKQQYTDGYIADHVQTLTGKSTATAILGYGVTKITVASATESASNDFVFALAAPVAAGIHKYLFVSPPDATTKTVQVVTTDALYDGSITTITWTTETGGPADAVHLIGVTAAAWGLASRNLSSAVALS